MTDAALAYDSATTEEAAIEPSPPSSYPPSVQPGIPKLGPKPNGWSRVSIGDLVEPVYRPAKLADDEQYQLVTAKRSRGGIVPRAILYGRDIRTKTQFYIEADDFLISRRQISHGACGLVPASLDRAVVSNEYVALKPKSALDLRFLQHLSHSVYFQQTCFHSSIGVHVEKLVFKIDDWLEWEIDVPPLAEQQQITDILDAWDRAITQTEALIDAKRRAYRHAVLRFSEHFRDSMVEFGELADLVTERIKPTHPVESIELEDIESETGRLLKKSMVRAGAGQRFRFQPGDTLFAKLRPYLRKYILANETGLCSTEAWVLRPKEAVYVPEMVFYAVQTPQFRTAAEIQAGSKMPRADWSLVEAMPVPVPPDKDQQQRWAHYLRSVGAEFPLLEQKRESLLSQKRGLMQKLLSGEMRLSSMEAAE